MEKNGSGKSVVKNTNKKKRSEVEQLRYELAKTEIETPKFKERTQ